MNKKNIIQVLAGSAMALLLFVSAPLAAGMNADKYEDNFEQRQYKQMPAPMVNSIQGIEAAPKIDNPTPDRVTNRSDRDRALTEQVQRSLEPYSGVTVDSEQGIVRLRGHVDTMQERDAIIQRARSVGGVNSVEADINVRQ